MKNLHFCFVCIQEQFIQCSQSVIFLVYYVFIWFNIKLVGWLLVKLFSVLSRVVSSAYMMGIHLLLAIARTLLEHFNMLLYVVYVAFKSF